MESSDNPFAVTLEPAAGNVLPVLKARTFAVMVAVFGGLVMAWCDRAYSGLPEVYRLMPTLAVFTGGVTVVVAMCFQMRAWKVLCTVPVAVVLGGCCTGWLWDGLVSDIYPNPKSYAKVIRVLFWLFIANALTVVPFMISLAIQAQVNWRFSLMFICLSGILGGSAVVVANLDLIPFARSFRVFAGMGTWQLVLLWLLTVVPEYSCWQGRTGSVVR